MGRARRVGQQEHERFQQGGGHRRLDEERLHVDPQLSGGVVAIIVSIDCRHLCEFEPVLTISCTVTEATKKKQAVAGVPLLHDTSTVQSP